VLSRKQFGRPIAAFQGVRFQLTEAEVERAGTEALATYALCSVQERRAGMVADALALRLAAVEAADVVFRVAHELHGAIGFCDESALSWLSRASEPLRRLPFGRSGTLDQLARMAGQGGLAGIFSGGIAPARLDELSPRLLYRPCSRRRTIQPGGPSQRHGPGSKWRVKGERVIRAKGLAQR
jgi:Acyl-CoA dehydrogenase, C-terminal domain